jgi:hypothetical protein
VLASLAREGPCSLHSHGTGGLTSFAGTAALISFARERPFAFGERERRRLRRRIGRAALCGAGTIPPGERSEPAIPGAAGLSRANEMSAATRRSRPIERRGPNEETRPLPRLTLQWA